MNKEKARKMLNWRLIVIVAITLLVSIYFTVASGTKLYVNGTQISASQGESFEKNGKTYVPLQAVIKGMGDSYTWNHSYRTAIIKKGGKQILITNGKSVAKVGNKFVPLSTKTIKKATVSSGHKALMINNIVYVPVDFIKALGYPVKIDGSNIYVGKLPQVEKPVETKPSEPAPQPKPSEPAPTPTPAPQPKPADPKPTPTPAPSSIDKGAVINSLASQGFCKDSSTLATLNIFNPGGCNGNMSVAVDLTNDNSMFILINAWEDPYTAETKLIPQKVRTALNLIIPSGSSNVFNIINNIDANGNHPQLNKVFTYDGLKTKVTFSNGSVRVIFSK